MLDVISYYLIQKSHPLPWPKISGVFRSLSYDRNSSADCRRLVSLLQFPQDYSSLKRQRHCEDFWFETGEKPW